MGCGSGTTCWRRWHLVAFGQLFIANPDLPERFRSNTPLSKPDPQTYYGGDAHGYIDYPALQGA